MRSIYLGVLLVCCLEFLSIQKEAEEAENEQVVRKKKSHLIEDLKVGKKVLDNLTNFLRQIVFGLDPRVEEVIELL